MFVKVEGKVTLVRPVQPENADEPMLTPSGMITLVRPVQPENADMPMLTPSGMVTLVRPEQSENADLPMLVTVKSLIPLFTLLGINTSPEILDLSYGTILVAFAPLTVKVQLIPLLSVHSAAHAWDIPQSKRANSNSFFILFEFLVLFEFIS